MQIDQYNNTRYSTVVCVTLCISEQELNGHSKESAYKKHTTRRFNQSAETRLHPGLYAL